MKCLTRTGSLLCICSLLILSCKNEVKNPPPELIASMNLKKGNIIVCGPSESQFGSVDFLVFSSTKTRKDFNLATAMLHSFEYDEAEKMYAKIIDEEPSCAMAYWGVAMSNFHPLWTAPTADELKKGAKAIEVARSIEKKTARETEYIEAIAKFYDGHEKTDHKTRTKAYEKAMEKIYSEHPDDKEAAIFYALALNTTAEPTDKTFANQKKAVSILNKIYEGKPDHPGIVHYIIHNYDYPELAELALPAARKYASIAPSSAHAQHMPSHIFTRLGLWDESIQSNIASMTSAKCYAESAGIKGHWDEELHAMDYLVYAYLQNGQNKKAMEQWDYLKTIKTVYPSNLKVSYSFSAIPSRYLLENKMWKEASSLQLPAADIDWAKFPWQRAVNHFTRLLGSVHLDDLNAARAELEKLKEIHETLKEKKSNYEAGQVSIQLKAGEAWIALKEGKKDKAIQLMTESANMEDATAKHPVTPGEVVPARELLGDLLMECKEFSKALEAYEYDLERHPNRLNGLYGAALAAEKSGNSGKASKYYSKLLEVTKKADEQRPEIVKASVFLKGNTL